jgi:hypothetical protein
VSTQPSPLGRYAGDAARGQPLHEVRLLGVPVQVLAAARQHHDDLMREFAVLAVAEQNPGSSVPQRLLTLTEILGDRYGAAANRPDTALDEALQRGARTLDLTDLVPADVVEAADELETLMAQADEFCCTEHILSLPRPPLLVQFAHWYRDEFRRQISGRPPRPWTDPWCRIASVDPRGLLRPTEGCW